MFSQWLREPFFHFIVIGVLLFGLYEYRAANAGSRTGNDIRITAGMIDDLSEQWRKQNGSEPGSTVLDELIESLVYQEVLLREAKRLGLDENDTIVRRRLVQKMEFLSANLSQMQRPDEQTLLSYFEQNRQNYQVPERRSLIHIYFSTEKRGEQASGDAALVLTELQREATSLEPTTAGDNFILQNNYPNISERRLGQIFGRQFAQTVFTLELGQWQGPIASEYGMHLVRVDHSSASYLPELAEVREKVIDDFMQTQLVALRQQSYDAMRERYQVSVENGRHAE